MGRRPEFLNITPGGRGPEAPPTFKIPKRATWNPEKVGGSLCIPWQRTVKAVLISPWNGSERSEQLGTRNGASDSERFQDRETSSRNVW